MIKIKRAYLPAEEGDGFRVLVDRLWPRGVKKENARIDLWAKDIAPSAELRQWFGHDPGKFPEFAEKYRQELQGNGSWESFRDEVRRHDVVTLVFAARDESCNNAVVLRSLLEGE